MLQRIVKRYGKTKLLLCLLDLISLSLAAVLLVWGRYSSGLFGQSEQFPWDRYVIFFVATFALILIFRLQDLYKHSIYTRVFEQIVRILRSLFYGFLLMIVVLFFIKSELLSEHIRLNILLFFLLAFSFLTVTRIWLFPKLSKELLESRLFARKVLIVGAGEAGEEVLKNLEKRRNLGFQVVGFVDDDKAKQGKEIHGYRVLGTLEDIVPIVQNNDIGEIFAAIRPISYEDLLKVIEKCKSANVQVSLISTHFDVVQEKKWEKEYSDLKVVSLFPRIAPKYYPLLKRWIDILAVLLITIILSPVLLMIALAIKLTSKGLVFYKATSIGKDGKPFTFYKFRSMYISSDRSAHKKLVAEFIQNGKRGEKLENDPRITPIGWLLRRFSLDELGQLVNVFKGDMSLVGPRPCTTYEYELYQDWHKRRFKVLPGITGVWQVSGRSEVPFNDMVIMDLYYVENLSLWLDLRILLRTIPVVISGRGAG